MKSYYEIYQELKKNNINVLDLSDALTVYGMVGDYLYYNCGREATEDECLRIKNVAKRVWFETDDIEFSLILEYLAIKYAEGSITLEELENMETQELLTKRMGQYELDDEDEWED